MKSSYQTGKEGCKQDCNLQYLNVLKVTSVRNKNSSITQNSMEETTLDILGTVMNSTKLRLSDDDNAELDSSRVLLDDESFLIGSILDNLLIGKEADEVEKEDQGEGVDSEENKLSRERYKFIKSTGEDMAHMLTKSMSPTQDARGFTGGRMKIQAKKGSREIANKVEGSEKSRTEFTDIINTTTTTNTQSPEVIIGEEEEEESKLLDINLIEWDPSIYKFNVIEQLRLLSPVTTYNVYNEDNPEPLTDKPINFQLGMNFTGLSAHKIPQIMCTYYDNENLTFSTKGIQVIERNTNEGYLLCNSTHMSDFGSAHIQNETTTVLTTANFEESTDVSQLQNYQFYKSVSKCYIYIYI